MIVAALAIASPAIVPEMKMPTFVSLCGLPEFLPCWLVGTPYYGKFVIAVYEELQKAPRSLKALYVLDDHMQPYQIGGTKDALLDCSILYDYTASFLPTLNEAQCCLNALYASLSLEELQQHEKLMREWEGESFQAHLQEKISWKQSAALTGEKMNFNTAWLERIQKAEVITKAAESVFVNLQGYPHLQRKKSDPGCD